jgi:hypothetical protein
MEIACVLFAFDRPQYTEEVLKSLERQTYTNVSWFAFVDGNYINDQVIGDEKGRAKVLRALVDSEIEFEEMFISQHNRGIGRQKDFSHELYEAFDVVMFFEDDMVVSKHYLEVLLHLYEEYGYHFITACDRGKATPPEAYQDPEAIERLGEWNTHFWGYLLDREGVEAIKQPLKDYCELVGENYHTRPANLIRNTFGVQASSHDGLLEKYLKINDIHRLATYLPRAKYIGEHGMHCNTKVFQKYGFHIDKPYEFINEPFRVDHDL